MVIGQDHNFSFCSTIIERHNDRKKDWIKGRKKRDAWMIEWKKKGKNWTAKVKKKEL